MRSMDMQLLCKNLGDTASRFSIGATYNDRTPVLFNDPVHFFTNSEKYIKYCDRCIENPCAGVVKGSDGRLQPTCGYIPYDVYSDLYGDDEPQDPELWEQRWLNVPYNEGDVIEYWKKDDKGETHRHVSHIVKDELGYYIYGDKEINLADISIVIRHDEQAEDEVFFRLRGAKDEK